MRKIHSWKNPSLERIHPWEKSSAEKKSTELEKIHPCGKCTSGTKIPSWKNPSSENPPPGKTRSLKKIHSWKKCNPKKIHPWKKSTFGKKRTSAVHVFSLRLVHSPPKGTTTVVFVSFEKKDFKKKPSGGNLFSNIVGPFYFFWCIQEKTVFFFLEVKSETNHFESRTRAK